LMADCLARQGIWAVFSGNAPQVMRFQIPLTASPDEVDDLLKRIRAAVKAMRWYLIPMMPLARMPLIRMLFDNVHVQIVAFNLMRDIEEFVRGVLGRKKQGVKA